MPDFFKIDRITEDHAEPISDREIVRNIVYSPEAKKNLSDELFKRYWGIYQKFCADDNERLCNALQYQHRTFKIADTFESNGVPYEKICGEATDVLRMYTVLKPSFDELVDELITRCETVIDQMICANPEADEETIYVASFSFFPDLFNTIIRSYSNLMDDEFTAYLYEKACDGLVKRHPEDIVETDLNWRKRIKRQVKGIRKDAYDNNDSIDGFIDDFIYGFLDYVGDKEYSAVASIRVLASELQEMATSHSEEEQESDSDTALEEEETKYFDGRTVDPTTEEIKSSGKKKTGSTGKRHSWLIPLLVASVIGVVLFVGFGSGTGSGSTESGIVATESEDASNTEKAYSEYSISNLAAKHYKEQHPYTKDVSYIRGKIQNYSQGSCVVLIIDRNNERLDQYVIDPVTLEGEDSHGNSISIGTDPQGKSSGSSNTTDEFDGYSAYSISKLSVAYFQLKYPGVEPEGQLIGRIQEYTESTCTVKIVDDNEDYYWAEYVVSPVTLQGHDDEGNTVDLKEALTRNGTSSSGGEPSTNDMVIPHEDGETYAINKSTGTFHEFTCGTAYNSWENNESNWMNTRESYSALIEEGFHACGNCIS